MTNKEIAALFNELATMMEIHGENEFKIKTYANAYLTLRKLDQPLLEQSKEENMMIKGIGSSVADKIEEIKKTNTFQVYEEFKNKTPKGVRDIIKIKGLGPKKVKTIWRELEIESLGELLYACQENRLVTLKGFGVKIQNEVISNIEFLNENTDSFLYPQIEKVEQELVKELKSLNPNTRIESTGAFRRHLQILEGLDILADASLILPNSIAQVNGKILFNERVPINFHYTSPEEFGSKWIETTGGSNKFLAKIDFKKEASRTESEILIDAFGKFIPAECRDNEDVQKLNIEALVTHSDLKGIIHNHSTYSDGIYSLRDMTMECMRLNYEYFVISDHSKTASYANGLNIDRLYTQWNEIDSINKEFPSFKVFKSIESDILSNGDLDYDDEILGKFDLVIASIHQNLNMDLDKAMIRLIKAVENPFTRILGHPTGRLLLSRKGYPVDFIKLIDACAANNVVIELNSNPYRLDMDYSHIDYAQEKGVLISINPDAHNLLAIQDVKYGIMAARRGNLQKSNCLNTMNLAEFETWISSKK